MFRMWAKIFRNNHMIKDTVICNGDYSISRTSMVFQAIDDICYEFDLGKPIWLDSNIADFKRHDKTRFNKDNFIESIDFDYLEIQVIEE
ncbi:hypothetical protein GPL15_06410 [Clostridium sp. MCC353]|uniref:hypothetical protein n=1 Tax=Clostridium sp. MCC353 TaxID=2592646 RepID=UPI001C00BE40|nr:hypothetical protein [Clostridium sp. MCC353]MBT9776137.1 hypothetical protein [Clostridium sp. MCC353]